MTEWWTAQEAGLIGGIGGAAIGVIFGGIGGGVGGPLAAMGKAKTLVLAIFALGIALGVACLGVGVVALSLGQPSHVWYVPLLAGVLLCSIMGPLFFAVRQRYRQHEQRKLAAEELRRG
ncbi:MAG: hypothetical protein R3B57_05185 [Phycisphaerales bacterium]